MLEQNYCLPKFLDRQNQQFRPIHGACDSVYHSLHCSGVGASIRHTAIISEDEEKKLWEYGILGLDNPKSLQRAVFYFIGKRFCILKVYKLVSIQYLGFYEVYINGCSIGNITVNFPSD